MHKLRDAMGQREDIYKLDNEVELDEMFFDVATDADVSLKRGAGSQAKAKVVVMAGVRTPSEEEAAAYKLAGGQVKGRQVGEFHKDEGGERHKQGDG